MIWLPNPKYPADHFGNQLTEIYRKARQETRRMISIASTAVAIMVCIQASYILDLL